MRFTLRSGPQEVEIVRREEVLSFHGIQDAFQYLKQFLGDAHSRAMLRHSLAEGGLQVGGRHFEDEELLMVLAHRIASGELKVIGRRLNQPVAPQDETTEATPRQVEEATPAPAPASSPPPVQGEEPPSKLEEAAQAETLKSAAESGAPLCET